MRSVWKPQRIAIVVLCLGIAALVFIANSEGWRGGVKWLSAPPPPRKSRLAFLGGLAAPVRERLSRLKQRFSGLPRLVDVQGTIFEFDATASLPNLPASATALTSESGAKVFIAPDGKEFEDQITRSPTFHVLTGSRLITANGAQGQIANYERVTLGRGTNISVQNVGWWLDIWPRAGGRSIELECFLTGTERAFRLASTDDPLAANESFLRTNVATGVRAKIPTNGCLLFIAGGTNQHGKVIGAILSPRIWQTK